MTFTPQDIQSKQFHVRMRGFDVEEVDGFLEKVAEEFLILTLENKQALEKITALEKHIESYKNKESSFQHAILSAQKISDEMVARSKKDADEILAKAKTEAKQLTTTSSKQAEELQTRVKAETDDLQSKVKAEAEKLRTRAQQESEEIKAQAQEEAHNLKTDAEKKIAVLKSELEELKTLKSRIQGDLKQMLHNYLGRLDEAVPPGLEEISTEPAATFRPAETVKEKTAPSQPQAVQEQNADEDDDDLSDLYEKINIIEENSEAAVVDEVVDLQAADAAGIDDIKAESLMAAAEDEDETLETVNLADLTLESPETENSDHNSLADEDLSIPDLDVAGIPDIDGDMLVELQDPLDDLEPAISIAREENN